MSDQQKPLPDSLNAWGEQFVAVAAEQPPKRRLPLGRGLLAGIAALAVTAGAAAAATDVFNFDPDETDVVTSKPGRVIAYMDLATDEPIRCPDGELLTYTVPPGGSSAGGRAECADGSVPETFTEQQQAYEEWLEGAPFGTALRDGPNFAFVLVDVESSE
jgi:hypothetical protein